MKILITGSNGFIGRNLCEYYSHHVIKGVSRSDNLLEVLLDFEPEVIINCAAEIYKVDEMWASNVLFTKQCLDHVKSHPYVKMIQIGSSSEYGVLDRAACENDRINPVDMYQATKGAATILCQGYAKNYDLDIVIARPYSVYGRYERPHRLFPKLWQAFYLNQPMNLYAGMHDFIYINDFIKGIDILVHSSRNINGDIVNFGSGKQISNLAVLEMFENITKRKAPVNYTPVMTKKFESAVWVCDTSYATQTYGFSCAYDLDSGVRDFIKTAQY